MKVSQVRRPGERYSSPYSRSLGIKMYGEGNLYPQMLRELINASRNGRTCVERRASYIEGNGIASSSLSSFVCNKRGETLDDTVHLIAEDVAYFDGLAIHVNYTITGEVASIAHVPFEACRLEEPDEGGVVKHIVIHTDWRGCASKNGKTIPVNESTVEKFHTFDPRRDVVLSQIEEAGGISEYRGQILYISRNGRNAYPLPVADAVITDLSTDEAMANVNYRNARNNFMPAGAFVVRRGLNANENDHSTAEALSQFQGDTNLGKLLVFEVETEEDVPKWLSIQGENYDGKFSNTSKDVMESIYAIFNQEGFARLRTGSVGFSADIIEQVKREYSEACAKYQRLISRALVMIFKAWPSSGYDAPESLQIEPLFKSVENEDANLTR